MGLWHTRSTDWVSLTLSPDSQPVKRSRNQKEPKISCLTLRLINWFSGPLPFFSWSGKRLLSEASLQPLSMHLPYLCDSVLRPWGPKMWLLFTPHSSSATPQTTWSESAVGLRGLGTLQGTQEPPELWNVEWSFARRRDAVLDS